MQDRQDQSAENSAIPATKEHTHTMGTTRIVRGREALRRRRHATSIGTAIFLGLGLVGLLASTADAATTPQRGAASGTVASIAGTSMEVQSATEGQTTVDWTTSTVFSTTVTKAVNSLVTGNCITVTGTPNKKSKTTVAARSITLTTASSSGSCTTVAGAGAGAGAGGFGGGGFAGRTGGAGGTGTGGGGFPGGARTGEGGAAGGARSGAGFRGGNFSFTFASGKITAVKGGTLTVKGVLISTTTSKTKSSSKSKSKKAIPKPKTETLKITTSKTTTVSQTQTTTSAALAVKDCVSALGAIGSTGTVTAETVRITSTSGGTCTGGFGGGFGGGGFGGGGTAGA
jgi:hypothetical protein